MFYIVESDYVGPNPDENVDGNMVFITQRPHLTNSSHEPRTHGWCGTSNDIETTGHGEYQTRREAENAISARWGECREESIDDHDLRLDIDEEDGETSDDFVVAAYRVGAYEPMTRSDTQDWLYSAMQEDIEADTTDERLVELEEEWDSAANAEGQTLWRRDIQDWARERRAELQEEQAEDEEDA